MWLCEYINGKMNESEKPSKHSITFPAPDDHGFFVRRSRDSARAIEYYVTGRFNYYHGMLELAAMNFFWCTEFLLRSFIRKDILYVEGIFRGKRHNILSIWKDEIKQNIGRDLMDDPNIDHVIARIWSFYKLRFTEDLTRPRIVWSNSKPLVSVNDNKVSGDCINIDINEIDAFFHRMYELSGLDQRNQILQAIIKSTTKTMDIYIKENKHSVFYLV